MLLYNEPQVNMLNNIHLNSEYSYIGTVCGMDIKPIPKLSPGEGYTRLNQNASVWRVPLCKNAEW